MQPILASAVAADPFAGGNVVSLGYTLLTAVYALLGAALGIYAPAVAASSVKLPCVTPQGAAVLVGCVGAAMMRLASVCWFIKVGD